MQEPDRGGAHVANIIVLTVTSLLVVCGVLLARAHLKRGRGDTRGAFLMAGYLFFVMLAQWVFQAHHVRSLDELRLFADALETGLFLSAIAWVIYVALEPYARRQWPHALIGWSRLLAGRFRDPLIGRDLMFGSLAGVGVALLVVLTRLIPGWLGAPPPAPIVSGLGTLGGLRLVAATLLAVQPGAMIVPIAIFFLIFGLRIVVRRMWIATALAFVLMSLLQGLQLQQTLPLVWAVVAAAAVWIILIFVIVRLGVLAGVISFVYANSLLALPLTADFSAWYADRAWLGRAVLALLTGYGFYVSLAGRPVFADALLQDA
jgi:hypothetical protein